MLALAILAVLCGADSWMAALPMISVWPQDNQLVRGQLATHQVLELLLAEGMRTDCRGVRHESIEEVDSGHGRVERRRLWTTDAWYGDVPQWKGLLRFTYIAPTCQVGDKRSVDRRYYISRLRQATPEFLLRKDKTYNVGIKTKAKAFSVPSIFSTS